MDSAIMLALGFEKDLLEQHHEYIKAADNFALFVEARFLIPSQGRGWWDGEQGAFKWDIGDMPSRIVTPNYWSNGLSPKKAKKLYLARHVELAKRIKP
jgi:hypothetical protein